MTSKEKAKYEELEAKDCLVDDEEVIDYYRLRCDILEERLELLEKENKELRETNDKLSNSVICIDFNTKDLIGRIEELEQQLAYECGCNAQLVDLQKENEKFNKALDKACEKLEDLDCPIGQGLVSDLDCENCNNNMKACWRKYFLKEVLEYSQNSYDSIQGKNQILKLQNQELKESFGKIIQQKVGEFNYVINQNSKLIQENQELKAKCKAIPPLAINESKVFKK